MQKLSLRLPIDLYEDLREEALLHRISMSDIVRGKILNRPPAEKGKSTSPLTNELPPIPPAEMEFAILEVLFLLREFLFERNAQILKKIDEKMERRFGKDRKRIV